MSDYTINSSDFLLLSSLNIPQELLQQNILELEEKLSFVDLSLVLHEECVLNSGALAETYTNTPGAK